MIRFRANSQLSTHDIIPPAHTATWAKHVPPANTYRRSGCGGRYLAEAALATGAAAGVAYKTLTRYQPRSGVALMATNVTGFLARTIEESSTSGDGLKTALRIISHACNGAALASTGVACAMAPPAVIAMAGAAIVAACVGVYYAGRAQLLGPLELPANVENFIDVPFALLMAWKLFALPVVGPLLVIEALLYGASIAAAFTHMYTHGQQSNEDGEKAGKKAGAELIAPLSLAAKFGHAPFFRWA